MRLKSASAMVFVACLAGSSAVAQQKDEVAELAAAYCAAAILYDETAAEALMSDDLRAAIATARAVSDAYALANPGDKPPLGDGLALTAYQDGRQSCTAEAVTESGAVLVYVPGSDPSSAWRDRIEVTRAADGRLVIADIVYAPDYMSRFSTWLVEVAKIE